MKKDTIKKKRRRVLIYFVLAIVCITLAIIRITFKADIEEENGKLELFDVINIDETRVELTDKKVDREKYINLANRQLEDLNLTDKRFESNENTKISAYKNNKEFLEEICLSDDNMNVTINSKNDELIDYRKKNINFKKNTFNEDKVKEKALEILKSFQMDSEYELTILNEFDDEIYMAKFFKKHGNYINRGEMISFSFSPEENKIAGYAKKDIPFANNEIKITEEQAKKTAKEYLKNMETTEMDITIKIVIPTLDTNKSLGFSQVYTNAKQTRLAYVCEFDDTYKTTVYVDCTTGEIIGYDMLM